MLSSDKEWQRYGDRDPYYGVCNEERFHGMNLDEKSVQAFFHSGADHIASVFDTIHAHLDSSFAPVTALDFGCGVGRLAIPLAERAGHVTGVDISNSMLREAEKNCLDSSINNVEFLLSDDGLSAVRGRFDLIHSFIVLQHVPVSRGERIIKRLLSLLNENGIGVLHLTYAKTSERKRIAPFLKRHIPLAKQLFNIRHGRSWNYPHMQMNDYDLNRILFMLQHIGANSLFLEFTDHKGALGVIIYFRKAS